MPALDRAKLYAGTGAFVDRRRSPSPDEVAVVCPVDGCGWSTTRPKHPANAAWSAGEAHRLWHVKGWF